MMKLSLYLSYLLGGVICTLAISLIYLDKSNPNSLKYFVIPTFLLLIVLAVFWLLKLKVSSSFIMLGLIVALFSLMGLITLFFLFPPSISLTLPPLFYAIVGLYF